MYKDTHIFCCTNYGYIDYTKNFIEYYKRLNTSWRLNVYCMDEKSVEALKDIKEINIIHYPIQDISEDFSKWQEDNFKKICYYRYKVIYPLFESKSIKYALYLDTDIVLLRDPVDYMIDYMESNDCVMSGMCDEYQACTNKESCVNICFGCCIIRCDPVITELFKESSYSPHIYSNLSDQHYFNKHIQSKHTYPTDLFIHPPKHNLLNAKTYLYHFNWLEGHQKKDAMIKNGYWINL